MKKSKKIFGILLVLIMTMVLLVGMAVTANAATVEVSSIGIENLRAPLAGNKPDYDIDYSNTRLVSKYSIDDPELIQDKTLVNGIAWYEVNRVSQSLPETERVMNKGESFEIGKKYRVRIFVVPNNVNTVFANTVTAKIYEMTSDTEGMTNYKTGTVITPTGNTNAQYKVVSATYECTRKSIVSVEITGLKIPKAGEYPDDDCNVLTEGVYTTGKVTWVHKTGEDAYGNGHYEAWGYDKAFVVGETYKYSIWLRTDYVNGYWFRTNQNGENVADIMVNGIVIDEDNICDTGYVDYVRGVEYEYYVAPKTISKIDIVGLTYPEAGKLPDFEAFPTTAGYDIVDLFWVDETLLRSLLDRNITYNDALSRAKLTKENGKTFEEGHKYMVFVEVAPQENYEINYDPNDDDTLSFVATVNGMNASEGSGCRGENATFSCVFGTPLLQLIHNIDITGVDAPVAGNVPDYDAVCGSDTYTIKDMFWVNTTKRDALIAEGKTNADAFAQAKLTKGDGKVFEAGCLYRVAFEIEPCKNYEIDYDPGDYDVLYYRATVNGNEASGNSGYRGENAGVSYNFAHTCDFREVVTKATLSKNGKVEIKCTCGDTKSTTTVYYPKTVSLSATKYLYDGKTKTPSLTVKDSKGNKLVKGTDYKISVASARKNVGKYAVKVTFVGNYSGTKTVYFYILPNKTTKMTATQNTSAILTKWAKVTGATGYSVEIYDSNNKKLNTKYTTALECKYSGLKAATVYKIKVTAYKVIDGEKVYSTAYSVLTTATAPAKPTLKATSPSKGKLSLSWTNVAGETGYVIQYSTKKNSGFKKLTDTKVNVVSYSKSVTSGKTYYFRVKAYKKVGDTYIYGAYSDVKGVKIK